LTVFAALVAVGIVFLTSSILYPTINSLLGRVSKLSRRVLQANLEILYVLGSAVALRDSYTDIHNYRVTLYGICIGQEIGIDDEEMRALIKGSLLHDVGKIGIKDSILLKPGKLTKEEFEEMKQHVAYGLNIVNRSEWLQDAVPVVGNHHEKFDGSGYLEGRNGASITRMARIFAVADVFDALTSKRPYKEPLGFDQTMRIMREGRGSHLDPTILDAFIGIAWDLYHTYANRDDAKTREALLKLGIQYFDPRFE